MLELVIEEKTPVPFKRFAKGGTGHRKGMGPGRYPKKTCEEILKILKSAQSNAKQKGIDNQVIKNIVAQKAAGTWHYGRHLRRRHKRTHIEVLIASKQKEEKPKKGKND